MVGGTTDFFLSFVDLADDNSRSAIPLQQDLVDQFDLVEARRRLVDQYRFSAGAEGNRGVFAAAGSLSVRYARVPRMPTWRRP
ncbi:MAG TPA: hypothetical protein VE673_07225 [Pseudonocardiaceae bacterium]|nr:hypothetical protein [Pseudonocardiaceae bacterium]